MEAITVVASVAAILALLYVAFIGQRTLIEWWHDRRATVFARNQAPANRVVHNLPSVPYATFVNRADEHEEAVRSLRTTKADRSQVVAIVGSGGTGKTALALHIAYHLLDNVEPGDTEHTRGVLWCSAKQYALTTSGVVRRSQQVSSLADIYRVIALTLDAGWILKSPLQDQRVLIRGLLAKWNYTLVMDNMESLDDDILADFLDHLPPGTDVVLTSRHRIGIGHEIELRPLARDDALELMALELSRRRIELPEASLQALCEATTGVPLAIVWVAAQLGAGYDEERLVAQLHTAGADVVGFAFQNSIEPLKGKPEYDLLRSMTLFPTDASREALGDTAGLGHSPSKRDDAIAVLVRLSLITHENDRFGMLPIARRYVASELALDPIFEKAARIRLNDYMRQLIGRSLGSEYWSPIQQWLVERTIELEVDTVLECVRWSVELGNDADTLYLGGPLVHHLWRFGRADDRERICQWCYSAAMNLDDSVWASWLCIDGLGYIYMNRENFDVADRVIQRGKELAESVGFNDAVALANAYSAEIAFASGDVESANTWIAEGHHEAETLPVAARIEAVKGHLAYVARDWSSAQVHLAKTVELRTQSDGYAPPTQSALLALAMSHERSNREVRKMLKDALAHERQTTEGLAYAHLGMALLNLRARRKRAAERWAVDARKYATKVGIKRAERDIEQTLQLARHRLI